MIISFGDKKTEDVFNEKKPPGLPADILKRALMKLQQIHLSGNVNDLRIPPSNHLEKLEGDRIGQYSIRINDQWRVCFVWDEDDNASRVEIIDYH